MSDKEENEGQKNDESEHEEKSPALSARRDKKLLILSEIRLKQETRDTVKKISNILNKAEEEREAEEVRFLEENQEVVQRLLKGRERKLKNEQRALETEDPEEELKQKCEQLADILRQSRSTVIYTGAGISTAASIPDYRGPQGVWTLLQRGEQLEAQDLSDAQPTVAHMCIAELHRKNHLKHVVSQNCDGLHLRSGLPRRSLSEVHGNMFVEICYNCKPHREYIRLFDVTERTGVRKHHTGRLCRKCGGKLRDTIVHFGEKGGQKSPYRWKEAVKAANNSDLILCLGSSLKILKSYGCLWCMDRLRSKRPKLVIVNLQWTPKDEAATIKINGRCDDVLQRVMKHLDYSVPEYNRETDPIFRMATSLTANEQETTSKKIMERPAALRSRRSASLSSETGNSSTSRDSSTSRESDSSGNPISGKSTHTMPDGSMQDQISANTQLQTGLVSGDVKPLHIGCSTSSPSIPLYGGYSSTVPHISPGGRLVSSISPGSLGSPISPGSFVPGGTGAPEPYHSPNGTGVKSDMLNDMPLLAQAQFIQLQMKLAQQRAQDPNQPLDLSRTGNNNLPSPSTVPNTPPPVPLSFTELVETLTTCPSCTFLGEYGMKKQRCNICDKLKAAHAAFHNQWLTGKLSPRSEHHARTFLGVSPGRSYGTSSTASPHGADYRSPVTPTSPTNPAQPHVDSMLKDHFYLKSSDMRKLSPKRDQTCTTSRLSETSEVQHSTVKQELDFSRHSATAISASPVPQFPHHVNTVPGWQRAWADGNALNQDQFSGSREMPAIQVCERGVMGIEQEAAKPTVPYVRSVSSDCVAELEGESDDKAQTEKKRKLTRCLSVPGWFGKGLNPKKRRRF